MLSKSSCLRLKSVWAIAIALFTLSISRVNCLIWSSFTSRSCFLRSMRRVMLELSSSHLWILVYCCWILSCKPSTLSWLVACCSRSLALSSLTYVYASSFSLITASISRSFRLPRLSILCILYSMSDVTVFIFNFVSQTRQIRPNSYSNVSFVDSLLIYGKGNCL